MKICCKCGQDKDLNEFPRSRNTLDGLYSWCKLCNTESTQKYYLKNRDLVLEKRRIQKQKNAESWCQFFDHYYGSNPRCEVCERKLIWMPKDKTNCGLAVNWDHKHDNKNHNIKPSNWLHNHICNYENKATWLDFDFGILCVYCNGSLPTNNREKWISRVLKYLECKNGIRV